MKSIIVSLLLSVLFLGSSFALPSKAVLILGAKLGSNKIQFEKELLEVKRLLEENNVSVSYFATANTDWREIQSKASEADLLVYSGHGISLAGSYGGFLLPNGQVITSDQVYRDLQLKKNALVFFLHTCGSAGSSANDLSPISEKVAQNRVINYANPFIHNGAAAVIAVNWNDQILSLLDDMFYSFKRDTLINSIGDTAFVSNPCKIGEAYLRICNDLNQSIDISVPLPTHEEMRVYVSHNDPRIERITIAAFDESGEYKAYYRNEKTGKKGSISYELSFVGKPDFTW